jgi:hypothetical protein
VSEAGLNDVCCTSGTACTAVGWALAANLIGDAPPPVVRWNGIRWSLQSSPDVQAGVELQGVSRTSITAYTAVGITSPGPAVSERWDGTRW